MKTFLKRITPVTAMILLSVLFLAACEAEAPRLDTVHTLSAGGQFSTNFNTDDPRRQIKCTITFEVLDEDAILELEPQVYKIRNSVLSVLGELTMDEVTTDRDLDEIGYRIVEKVNLDLDARGGVTLVTRAYFSEFVIS